MSWYLHSDQQQRLNGNSLRLIKCTIIKSLALVHIVPKQSREKEMFMGLFYFCSPSFVREMVFVCWSIKTLDGESQHLFTTAKREEIMQN